MVHVGLSMLDFCNVELALRADMLVLPKMNAREDPNAPKQPADI